MKLTPLESPDLFKDHWKKAVNLDISRHGNLSKTYPGKEITYILQTKEVDPFGWQTMPVQLDYRLTVDLSTSDPAQPPKTRDLGSVTSNSIFLVLKENGWLVFNEEDAMLLKYFDDTSKILSEIVSRNYEQASRRAK